MTLQRVRKLAGLLRRPATWRALLLTRTAAAIEHDAMLRHTRPDLVIDVGANKGQFALAVRSALPTAKVISFEPLESEARKFERNFLGIEGVVLHRLALGAGAGQRDFYVTNRPDSSSLLRPGARQDEIFGVGTARRVEVAVERLDVVLPLLSQFGTVLLKIDVQGAEAEVIEGGDGVLGEIRFVYTEASYIELYEGQSLAMDLIHTMGDRGFALRGVYNQQAVGDFGPVQADLLFENVALCHSEPR